MQARTFGVLLLLGAIWGSSYMLIKISVAEMPPETLVALRLVVSALILLGVLYGRGLRLPTRPRTWLDLVFLAVSGLVIPYMLITWGEQYIASSAAAILNAATPLFAVLLTYVWTREEQLSGVKVVGVALGFVGVVVAVGVAELGLSGMGALAQGAVLLAALCYAVAGIYGRRAFRGVPALVPATGQLLAGAVIMTPIALALRGIPAPLPSATALGALLLLSVVGTALAYVLLYWLMERIGATRTSMVTYLLPPFALFYGALILNEPITPTTVTGLALVIAGILLANGVIRPRRAARAPGPASKAL